MPPTEHAVLGASGSHRWMKCPGSIGMSEGTVDLGSEYAWEGTAAHELAEQSLRYGFAPQMKVGTFIHVPVTEDHFAIIEVTEEMADAISDFVDAVYARKAELEELYPDVELLIEERFTLEPLNPPGPMFGTADVVLLSKSGSYMEVIDLKYGQGVVVEVVDNSQLMYYALGACVAREFIPDTLRCTIFQPRASHADGPLRHFDFGREDLIAFKRVLFAAAERTFEPDAPLVPGPHCRFCPAKVKCPAIAEYTLELAQSTFGAIATPPEEGDVVLPEPDLMDPERLAEILTAAPMIMEWLRDVEAHALHAAERGKKIPGYKLVRGRSNRKWTDPDRADAYLQRKKIRKGERTVTKLVSPRQAEKLLKARGHDPSKLEKYWEKPEGKIKLASADDKRPEVLPVVAQAFTALPVSAPTEEGTDE